MPEVRLAIINCFNLIAKNIGLRKVFLKPNIIHILLNHAVILCEKEVIEKEFPIKFETIRLLCTLCTVKTNRFYIPGETNIVERLR